MQRYGIGDVNLIKPGIGEATRVLLRRVPRLLLLRERTTRPWRTCACWPKKRRCRSRSTRHCPTSLYP